MKIKASINNFSTRMLFLLLKEREKELLSIQINIDNINGQNVSLLKSRMNQIKMTIEIVKSIIVDRYIEEDISLLKAIKMLEHSTSIIEEDIFKEIITIKILTKDELVPIDLLDKAISSLEVEQLVDIINNRKGTIYEELANDSYNQKYLDVDEEVYKELLLKIENDMEEC